MNRAQKGFQNEHAIFRQQLEAGSVGKVIGMTLFWYQPTACSHLASDSLWYDEVASLYFKIL